MNRTGLDTSALSRMLRRMAGDGSIEWVMEPIQAGLLRRRAAEKETHEE